MWVAWGKMNSCSRAAAQSHHQGLADLTSHLPYPICARPQFRRTMCEFVTPSTMSELMDGGATVRRSY